MAVHRKYIGSELVGADAQNRKRIHFGLVAENLLAQTGWWVLRRISSAPALSALALPDKHQRIEGGRGWACGLGWLSRK
jgi:hypothetical protein